MSHRLKNPINTVCFRCDQTPCILSSLGEDIPDQVYFCSAKCAELFEEGEISILWTGDVADLAERLVDALSEDELSKLAVLLSAK